MTRNFLNFVKAKILQTQEPQQIPSRMNTKKTTPKHVLVRLSHTKGKRKTLKAIYHKKHITCG